MRITAINLSNINKAVTGVTETVRKSKLLIDDISEKIGKTNERIKTKISDSAKLFQRRQQAIRRKVREDLIEASGLGGAMRRTNKIISTSTRGFLGRILDFVGTILVGWAIVNIPKIVKLAENLIKRLNNFFKVITGFTNGLTEFFTKFNAELSLIVSRLSEIDLQSLSDRITNIVTRLQQSFKRMESNFIREVLGFSKMSDEDLIKNFGTDVDEEIKKEVEKNIDEQISEDVFENLPENIQEAIKLKMSFEEDFMLDEIDLETVQSGDIEEIKKMLEESNIVGKKNEETGQIEYEKRVQNNDLLEDIGNFFKGPGDDNLTQEQLDDFKNYINNITKNREITSSVNKTQKIIISNNYRKIDTKKSDEKFEPQIAFSGSMVNSDDRMISDLLLTNIRA
jgi:hypothetical protein